MNNEFTVYTLPVFDWHGKNYLVVKEIYLFGGLSIRMSKDLSILVYMINVTFLFFLEDKNFSGSLISRRVSQLI